MRSSAILALLGATSAKVGFKFQHANSVNPFQGKTVYPNPTFTSNVKKTEADHQDVADMLKVTEKIGAATWLDNMEHIALLEPLLKGAQASGDVPMIIVYDLPNRDCAALASNGEIPCADSNCSDGLNTYKTKYVDEIVKVLKKYPQVPVVAIIEPDSLPNLATNLGVYKCQQAQRAYKEGIAYSLKEIAALGNVTSYLDAAHGGWLGWQSNLTKIAPIFKEVLNAAGGQDVIRGFVTNTANYQMLGSMDNKLDPCNLHSQYNFANDEIHFIDLLDKEMVKSGVSGMRYITDTSRNGQVNERSDCSNWCNIQGAGLGRRPTTDVSDLGLPQLDALVWVKTPGESDGTSNQSAKRHDPHCNSSDSHMPAPEAGAWSEDIYVMLAKNANPPLTSEMGYFLH